MKKLINFCRAYGLDFRITYDRDLDRSLLRFSIIGTNIYYGLIAPYEMSSLGDYVDYDEYIFDQVIRNFNFDRNVYNRIANKDVTKDKPEEPDCTRNLRVYEPTVRLQPPEQVINHIFRRANVIRLDNPITGAIQFTSCNVYAPITEEEQAFIREYMGDILPGIPEISFKVLGRE